MKQSRFNFLELEWPDLLSLIVEIEGSIHTKSVSK